MNKEDARTFVGTYHTIYGWDPSDFYIKDHLARGTQPDGVNCLRPLNIFQTDEIPQRSIKLVDPVDARKYSWVDSKILGTPLLNIILHP